MKRGIIISVALAAVLLVIFFQKDLFGKKEDMPAKQGSYQNFAVKVNAVAVSPEKLENKIFTTGTVLPNEQVEIRSEISGRITGVYFKEGQKVNKGQLLIKINDNDLQAQHKKLKLQEKLAEEDEFRKRRLLEIKGISQEEYDKAQNLLNTFKADLEYLKSQLLKTTIYAPFSGVAGLRYVSEGGFISPTNIISTIQDIDPVKIEFSIPEKYAHILKSGSEISFTVTGKDNPVKGKVYAIAPQIDLNTRSITVRAIAANSDRSITPGAFVKIGLLLETIDHAVLIPAEAIVPELAGQKVYVARSGIATAVPVKTGIRTEGQIQITNGLTPSDTVIISGILQLKDGAKVEVKEVVKKDNLKIQVQTN